MKKKVSLLISLSLLLQGFIMPTTSPQIILTLGDAQISNASSPDTHSRADIDDLVTGDAQRSLKHATYEPDKWILDGSFHFAPDPAHIGFVSDEISLVDKSFTSDPVLTITLDAAVDIEQGITFEFSGVSNDYCDSLLIEYKDAGSSLIYSNTYAPDGYNYFAEIADVSKPAAAIKYIVITFHSTSTAYRHIKLLDVYADGVSFDKANIKAAKIIEEINPVSVESPSNELNFSINNPDSNFSIVDPQGFYAGLREGLRVEAYENVDENRAYMGRFYLDGWNSKNEDLAEFQCADALGKLGDETTYGKRFHYTAFTPWTAQDVMDCIMGYLSGSCGLDDPSDVDYEIDSSLASTPVDGWLAVQSRRDALQQLAISVGGYLDCSRSDKVAIKPLELVADISSYDFALGSSDIREGSTVNLKKQITGIKIVSHSYEYVLYGGGDTTYISQDVVAGVYLFLLKNERIYDLTPDFLNSTATIDAGSLKTSANYMQITVTGAGNLIVNKSSELIDNKIEYTLLVPDLPANTPENIIVIENATLVNPDNVADVALRLLTYYQQRYAIETKLFASEIATGDSAEIDTQSSKQLGGIVERMEIDLTGGFVQNMRTRGAILPYTQTWVGVEYLMLGGGGAGASHALAGGGGEGDFRHGIDLLVKGTAYNIVIGVGGVGSIGGSGTNGGDTTFNSHTAYGGGHGAKGSHTSTAADDGGDGGSGGGGGGNDSGVGFDGNGGIGYRSDGGQGSNGVPNYGGGGGGGAGEDGETGVTSNGGDGLDSDITGSVVFYGGGGGGIGNSVAGSGGTGGGGDGNRTGAGTDGTDGLGSGGGASHPSYAGGDGGDGVFILRIKTSQYSGVATGSPAVTVDGEYTVLKYLSNGSYTP